MTVLAAVRAALARHLRDELAEARVVVAHLSEQRIDARPNCLAVRLVVV